MSKATKEFFEQLKSGQEPGLLEAIKEAVPPLREMAGQLWDGMKPMFDHGRTEVAAALFAGHGHVMYMQGQEGNGQSQDQAIEAVKQPEIQQEQSRGGMER